MIFFIIKVGKSYPKRFFKNAKKKPRSNLAKWLCAACGQSNYIISQRAIAQAKSGETIYKSLDGLVATRSNSQTHSVVLKMEMGDMFPKTNLIMCRPVVQDQEEQLQ